MSFSHCNNKASAASLPCVCLARYCKSLTSLPKACRLSTARCGSTLMSEWLNTASNMLMRYWLANSPSFCSVVWPMPRLGVVTQRKKAGSSSLFTHRRSQAHRSRISARSKKLWPPETLYGIAALRNACSSTRDWWLARYSTAKCFQSRQWLKPAPVSLPALKLCMRSTMRSASCSSLSASDKRTGSPGPSSENSFFG